MGIPNLEAKVVVGADGAKSAVRELSGIRVQTRGYSSSYLVTVAGGTVESSDDATLLDERKDVR